MLQREKIPFALAALLGLLTWAVTRAVDRVLQAPLIKYVEVDRRANGVRTIQFDVENISSTLYTGLELTLLLDSGRFIKQPTVATVLPMMPDDNPPKVAEDSATFTLPEIQPGGQLRISAQISDDANPRLGMRNPKSAGRLVRPSIHTWLVENELVVLLAIALAGVALVIAYIYALMKHQELSHGNKTEPVTP